MKMFGNKRGGRAGIKDKAGPSGKKGPNRKGKRTLIIVAAALLVIVLGVWATWSSYVKPPERTPPGDGDAQADGTEQTPDAEGNTPTPPPEYKKGVYTVLLAGTDEADYNADVIMVATFDTEAGTVNVLSIPRDTMIDVDRSNKKINASYGVGKSETGDQAGGAEALKKAIGTVIGFEPDYCCIVQFEGFSAIVDKLGGVEFDVPYNMHKSDPYINVSKGLQVVDGEKALQIVRFRDYTQGDLTRIAVAQAFLKATAKQMLSLKNVTKIPDLVGTIYDYMYTDLTTGSMIWFGTQLMKINEEDINFYTLPTTMGSYNGQSYLYVDEEAALDMVNETVNPLEKPITSDDISIVRLVSYKTPAPSPKSTPDDTEPSPDASPAQTPTSSPQPSVSGSPTPPPTSSPGASPVISPSPTPTPSPSPTSSLSPSAPAVGATPEAE